VATDCPFAKLQFLDCGEKTEAGAVAMIHVLVKRWGGGQGSFDSAERSASRIVLLRSG